MISFRSWAWVVPAAFIVWFLTPVFAQDPEEAAAPMSALYLKVLDSSTGGGVTPKNITINSKAAAFQVEAGSLIALSLPDGTHAVAVEAEGYSPMELSATVSGEQTPVMEIELDRLGQETLDAIPEDAAVLEGNVSDADTGELLENVSISLLDVRQTTKTDVAGHYHFEIITGEANAISRPAVTMELKTEGYTPLRMNNVLVAPGQRRQMPVRLSRSTSDTETMVIVQPDDDVMPGSHRTAEWAYDVTLR